MRRYVLEAWLKENPGHYYDDICVLHPNETVWDGNFNLFAFPPDEDDQRYLEICGLMGDPTPYNPQALLDALRPQKEKDGK
jgi:hypothetical protein